MPFPLCQFSHLCCHRIARGSMFLISEIFPLISKVLCYVHTMFYMVLVRFVFFWPPQFQGGTYSYLHPWNLSQIGIQSNLNLFTENQTGSTSMLSSELSEVMNSLRKSSNSSPSMKPLPVVICVICYRV